MIIDTSALVAIFIQETGHEGLVEAVADASAAAVARRRWSKRESCLSVRMRLDARPLLERFLHDFGIMVIPFGEDHWREALDAFNKFGKGRHPAALNLGDCFSYAVASLAEQPLLCVGDDFRQDRPDGPPA